MVLSLTELGKRLKEKRIEKDITIEHLQKITKIQKRYLVAVEEGNYDILPGKFYARAFLKQYAEAVDLNPDQLFDEYAEEIPKTNSEEFPQRISRTKTKHTAINTKNSAFLSLLPKLLVLILVIGIAVAIWVFLQDGTEVEEQQPTQDTPEATVESDFGSNNGGADKKGQEDHTSPTVDNEPAAESENNETTSRKDDNAQRLIKIGEKKGPTPYIAYKLKGTQQFQVQLEALENKRSYVGIENGKGKSFLSEELRNEGKDNSSFKKVVEFDFSSEKQIEFNIGNTQGIQMKINNEIFTFPYDTPHQKIKILFSNEKE